MILIAHKFWKKSIQGTVIYSSSDPTSHSFFYSRAPPQILNVQVGQPVELRVARRINEDYVPSTAGPTRAFVGTGNRLGAPVHPISGTEHPMPGRFDERGGPSEPQRVTTRFEVDQSQPTTSIQLRLADGTRHVSSLTHTPTALWLTMQQNGMQDEPHTHRWRHKELHQCVGAPHSLLLLLTDHVPRADAVNLTRPYTIGTTFPNKTLDDDTQTIKDAGLANSVILQKWA